MNRFSIFIILFTLHSCASRSDYMTDRQIGTESKKIVVKDKEIAEVLDLKPQLKFPIRLGVFISESSWGNSEIQKEQKDALFTSLDDLKKHGVISDAFLLSRNIIPSHGGYYSYKGNYDFLKNLRYGAARIHADAILVIDVESSYKNNSNFLSIFYLTIVGMWLFPGSGVDAKTVIYSTLWDTRNEYLYFAREDEETESIIRPLAIINKRDASEKALDKAWKEFLKNNRETFSKLKDKLK